MNIRLSACMIVKDEEATLAKCLQSIQGVVDEIVVVDTGSTDRTRKIAKNHGARVFDFPWCDDFSAARNESLRHARGDWVLVIDADEWLLPGARHVIRNAPNTDANAWLVLVESYTGARTINNYTPRLLRKTSGLKYEGRIHEMPTFSGEAQYLPGADIGHSGYMAEVKLAKNKRARNEALLRLDVAERPECAYAWMNLGRHTAVSDTVEAEEAFTKALELSSDDQETLRRFAFDFLSAYYANAGRVEEALRICGQARECGVVSIQTLYAEALALAHAGRLPDALKSIDECCSMPWPRVFYGAAQMNTKRHELRELIRDMMRGVAV